MEQKIAIILWVERILYVTSFEIIYYKMEWLDKKYCYRLMYCGLVIIPLISDPL